MLNHATLARLMRVLPLADVVRLKNSAWDAQRLENIWTRKLEDRFEDLTIQIFEYMRVHGEPPRDLDLTAFFVDHSFEVMAYAFKVAYGHAEILNPVPETKQLSGPPRPRMPKSLGELMQQWDFWRKKKLIPKRQKALAEAVKREYLKKVQQVWRKHSEDFRSGDEGRQSAAISAIRKAAPFGRAKMIVETETTYYYNHVRRSVYDQAEDVTHYLFVALRDNATTAWCKTRTGLVYKKGDPLLEKETPPCHWYCRSELLPLTIMNPKHLALINNPALDRRRHTCAPLPKGWNKRSA